MTNAIQQEEIARMTRLRLFLWDDPAGKKAVSSYDQALFLFNITFKEADVKANERIKLTAKALKMRCFFKFNFSNDLNRYTEEIYDFVFRSLFESNLLPKKARPGLLARQVTDHIMGSFRFHRRPAQRQRAPVLGGCPRLVFVVDIIVTNIRGHVEVLFEDEDKDKDKDKDEDEEKEVRQEDMNNNETRIMQEDDDTNSILLRFETLDRTLENFDQERSRFLNLFDQIFFPGIMHTEAHNNTSQDLMMSDTDPLTHDNHLLEEDNVVISEDNLEANNDDNKDEINEILRCLLTLWTNIRLMDDDTNTHSNYNDAASDLELEIRSLRKVRANIEIIQGIIGENNNKEDDEIGEICLCSICLEEMSREVETVKLVRCGHMFHGKCIFKWFYRNLEHLCPYCRSNKTLINVYLRRS